MASCPPSTSGRECIEQCHQLRVLPSGSGRWGVAGQRLLPARQQRRSNKKAGVQAALTMAEEMVSETKSSDRRQIQQMLNRLVPWLVPARTLCIFSKFLTCRSSLSTVCCVSREYKPGFTTLIESETFAKGLDETVVRAISAKKNEPVIAALLLLSNEASSVWITPLFLASRPSQS